MMLPTAAAMTTRRSSFSEIFGGGIRCPPFPSRWLRLRPRPYMHCARLSTLMASTQAARSSSVSTAMPYRVVGLSTTRCWRAARHLTEGIKGCQAYINLPYAWQRHVCGPGIVKSVHHEHDLTDVAVVLHVLVGGGRVGECKRGIDNRANT